MIEFSFFYSIADYNCKTIKSNKQILENRYPAKLIINLFELLETTVDKSYIIGKYIKKICCGSTGVSKISDQGVQREVPEALRGYSGLLWIAQGAAQGDEGINPAGLRELIVFRGGSVTVTIIT